MCLEDPSPTTTVLGNGRASVAGVVHAVRDWRDHSMADCQSTGVTNDVPAGKLHLRRPTLAERRERTTTAARNLLLLRSGVAVVLAAV